MVARLTVAKLRDVGSNPTHNILFLFFFSGGFSMSMHYGNSIQTDDLFDYRTNSFDYPEFDHKIAHAKVRSLEKINDILLQSNPSDYVIWNDKSGEIIGDFLTKIGIMNGTDDDHKLWMNEGVPADIVIDDTVSLNDFVLQAYIYKDDSATELYGIFSIRLLLYNEKLYIAIHDSYHNHIFVMTASVHSHKFKIDTDIVYTSIDLNRPQLDIEALNFATRFNFRMSNVILVFWYGINVMMLNPEIKDFAFSETRKAKAPKNKIIQGKQERNQRKRKAKYVKYKYLNNDILTSEKSPLVRKTLCWYVIGHYRTYKKTGKRIWIKGYWKGPMRKAHKNFDEGRERILK